MIPNSVNQNGIGRFPDFSSPFGRMSLAMQDHIFQVLHSVPSLLDMPTATSPYKVFHVMSQSCENHTGSHFGVQLNGDLLHDAHAKCSPNLTADLPHKYVQYCYRYIICET